LGATPHPSRIFVIYFLPVITPFRAACVGIGTVPISREAVADTPQLDDKTITDLSLQAAPKIVQITKLAVMVIRERCCITFDISSFIASSSRPPTLT
jgi:hypothetical protein